jgi:hypothetical protein
MSQESALPILEGLKNRVRHLKRETYALYLAARHPQTPWYAKLFAAGAVAYAFSPIDLIRDFVEGATGPWEDHEPGRWVVETSDGSQAWEVVVEPDDGDRRPDRGEATRPLRMTQPLKKPLQPTGYASG